MGSKREPAVPLPDGWELANGRYRLEEVLGAGGFGITYKAWDRDGRRPVAVKELYPRGVAARDKDGVTLRPLARERPRKGQSGFSYLQGRFVEEANLIWSFREQPEILNVYAVFDENGTSYYVMEYLEGETLQRFLDRRGPYDWEEYRGILSQMLDSLQILHERGLIHRDVSPDNVFLLNSGKVKLLDFGSARNYVTADHFTTILKDYYAPPEQYGNKNAQGPQTDIYAVSATSYFALSGRHPAVSADRVMEKGIDPLIPLEKLCPELPAQVSDAIGRGMELDISRRFPSVRGMKEALFPPTPRQWWLVCVGGQWAGRAWPLRQGQLIRMGRSKSCGIVYGENTPGVSRLHCSFFCADNGAIYVRDEHSTYGTYRNERQLYPDAWEEVSPEDTIWLGEEAFQIR